MYIDGNNNSKLKFERVMMLVTFYGSYGRVTGCVERVNDIHGTNKIYVADDEMVWGFITKTYLISF